MAYIKKLNFWRQTHHGTGKSHCDSRGYNGADASTIKPETTFAELSFDSLDVAELVMSLEDEFGVTIEMNENLKTVGDITKYIEEKLA